jgi:predicted alpha/beta-hydrolase family hydrolase
MDSPFLTALAAGIAAADIAVVRFEFSHLRERRALGTRRPPPRMPALQIEYRAVLDGLDRDTHVVIGGRSLGGRVASLLLEHVDALALVAFNYPFHPPRRPEVTRTAHLERLSKPALIVQGERDSFGTPNDVETYQLSASISIRWMPDGDHAFVPRRRSERTWAANLREASEAATEFIRAVASVR